MAVQVSDEDIAVEGVARRWVTWSISGTRSRLLLAPWLMAVWLLTPQPAEAASREPEQTPKARATAVRAKARAKDKSADDGVPRFIDPLEGCEEDRNQEVDVHAQKLLGGLGDLSQVNVQVLIATVPDPIETSFAAAFDASLSSIRTAFAALGYAGGGYFLPWRDSDAVASEGGEEKSSRKRLSGRCVPGILSFRKSSAPAAEGSARSRNQGAVSSVGVAGAGVQPSGEAVSPLRPDPVDVAFVLLVGETPAHGVFANALGQALTFARDVHRDRLAILGPIFSGSASSLHNTIERWRSQPARGSGEAGEPNASGKEGPEPSIEIISGTATSPGVRREMIGRGVRFSATVVPDDVQTCTIYRYLDRLSIQMRQVALMIEASTTFGSFFRDFGCRPTQPRGGTPRASAALPLRPRMIVPFPLHVSELRNAEERRRRAGRSDKASAGALLVDTQLELQIEQRQYHMDSVPALSPDLTAAEVQLALTEQLGTVCRQDIRALGILATDVRDVTALAEEARRRCPRLLLFALGPDRILHHSRYRSLDGLLVASSYPLHAAVSTWTFPFRGRRLIETFSSESAQGIYNAAILLMGGDSRNLVDYGVPPELDEEASNRPPVWISAVGREGFWPVHVAFYGKDDKGFVNAVPKAAHAGRSAPGGWARRFTVPDGFVFLFALLLLFTTANLVAFVAQSNPLAPPSRRRSVWSWLDLYRPVEPPFERRRNAVIACAFTVLAVVNAGAAVLFAIPGYVGDDPAMRLEAIGAAFLVGFLMAAAVGVLAFSPVWAREEPRTGPNRRFVAMFVAGGLALGAGLGSLLPAIGRALGGYEPDLTLFFKRTVDVTSGFSPVPGAVLYPLALLAAAMTELGRIRLLDFAGRFEKACFAISCSRTTTGPSVGRAVQTGVRGVLFVLGASLFGIIVTIHDYHHPFEGPWLGYLFCLAGPNVIAAMIVLQLYRFVRTWAGMRRDFHEYLEARTLPAFRKRLKPFLLRLLLRPLDPTLAKILVAHCGPLAEATADEDNREAVRLALLASYGRAHLHNFLTFVTGAGVLLIVMSTCYPFKLLHSVDILTWVVALAVILTTAFVLIQMNRDELLSRIAGTVPGRLSVDRGLVSSLFIHVGVPVLGLAATRFSTVGVLLEDLLAPLLQLLGGIGAG